jgi:TetR/AcrR family transcriptional regulator, cholesterol catabolism regulator
MTAIAKKKRPRSEAHDEKRTHIIDCCAKLFDKVGYFNTSMQMLADEVGLGKPTLYHYFPSKISILYAIHNSHISGLLARLEGRDGEDPAAALEFACADILREIATHPGYVRAFMEHYHDLEGEMKDNIRIARQTYFAKIQGLIVRGIESGQFRSCDPLMAAFAFVGICNWAYKWYPAMSSKRSPEEVATALFGPLLYGLKAE